MPNIDKLDKITCPDPVGKDHLIDQFVVLNLFGIFVMTEDETYCA